MDEKVQFSENNEFNKMIKIVKYKRFRLSIKGEWNVMLVPFQFRNAINIVLIGVHDQWHAMSNNENKNKKSKNWVFVL